MLYRMTVLLVVLSFLCLVGLAGWPGTLAAQDRPIVRVSPVGGNQDQVFTFSGEGFAANARLTSEIKTPDGQTFTLQKDGQPAIWVVSDQGTFAIEIVPSRDFAGTSPGVWTNKFCIEGTSDCAELGFYIVLGANPEVGVAPVSGNQDQVFTFAGQNFVAGTRLTVEMRSPDGQTFGLVKDGQPAVWVVSDQGTFAIEILPARDFAGAAAGTWSARLCVEGTAVCWSGTFEISVTTTPPPPPAASAPVIVVAPASGNQDQVFTFAGQGFTAGTRLTVEMKSPDGQTFILQKDGQPAVWVVSDQGTFAIEILPSRDFAGAAAGTWTANFCVEGTPQCWSGTFDIAL